MKTTLQYIKLVLLSGLLLMALANRVSAQKIVTDTQVWSSLAPGSSESVTINSGGILYIDVSSASCGSITINTGGALYFDGVADRSVAVSGDVTIAGTGTLNMSAGVRVNTVKIAGTFTKSAGGTFTPGLGTIEYNKNGAQTVADLTYKNLTLSGGGAKTIGTVTVNGVLSLRDGASATGSAPTYGSNASLEYAGTAAQTTGVEFLATMAQPVTVKNVVADGGGTTLGASRITTGTLTIAASSILKDGGYTLTAQGNVVNSGTHVSTAAGKLLLSGGAGQTISAGNYGNVEINNTSGLTLKNATVVRGKLTINSGCLVTLENGGSSTASALTIGGIVRTSGTWGSSSSTAANKNNTFFAEAGTGVLTVLDKPAATFTGISDSQSITYGTSSVTFGGKVKGSNANGDVYPPNGESITVTINGVQTFGTTSGGDGTFSVTVTTGSIPYSATPYTITYSYAGGTDLSTGSNTAKTLTVNKKEITVTPTAISWTYGNPEGALAYTYTPVNGLVGSDVFSGSLSRDAGNSAGTYNITQGSLSLSGNYTLTFVTGVKVTINTRPITVTVDAQSKTYGNTDPVFTYQVTSGTVVAGDAPTGALTRAAGENVGPYAISIGTLAYGNNYALTFNGANLTINKRTLTITADAKSKIYGESDPSLTYVSSGLASGDSLTGSLQRVAGEIVGNSPYAINNDGAADTKVRLSGSVGGNYNITFVGNSLAITKRTITVSRVGATVTKKYGEDRPTLVSYSNLASFKVGDVTTPHNPDSAPTITCTEAKGSAPGDYNFTINQDCSDGNYTVAYGTLAGVLKVEKKALTITADNKEKNYDGLVFPMGSFTVTGSGFVTIPPAVQETVGNLGGTLSFTGEGTTKTTMGEWSVTPTGYTSANYDITFVPGKLKIKGPSRQTDLAGTQTWGPGGTLDWKIDQANGGTKGSSPGWGWLNINGALDITATTGSKFIVNARTEVLNTSVGTVSAGSMAKFDPTRPYTWTIATATSIKINGTAWNASSNPFDENVFTVNTANFANNFFGGTFKVALDGLNINIVFTPKEDPTSVSDLLTAVRASDVDVVYIRPSNGVLTIGPNDTLRLELNVANLKKPVSALQAMLNFSSSFFVAGTGTGKPVIEVGGGGVWDQMITKSWTAGGDLDVVVGVSLQSATGTQADGTAAYITLTPTKTTTGPTRIKFRADVDPNAAEPTQSTVLTDTTGAIVWPARVGSDTITIVVDGTAPVIDNANITATQVQPHVTTALNVKNGPAINADTGAITATNTVRGDVNITVIASDNTGGTGINGYPTVSITDGTTTVSATTVSQNGSTYTYKWTVDANTANGVWTATVTAKDYANNTSAAKTFTLNVNKYQITGVVELQGFAGTTRTVNFRAGDGNAGTPVKTWDLPLTFTSGSFLGVGSFQDFPSIANTLKSPAGSDSISYFMRYGEITDVNNANLATLAAKLKTPNNNLSAYIRAQLLGDIASDASLAAIAGTLTNPTKSVHTYLISKLSDSTIATLALYTADAAGKAATKGALKKAILDDFNNKIVLGSYFYEATRFASVTLRGATTTQKGVVDALNPAATAGNVELVKFNRMLLEDIYDTTHYTAGTLTATTAQALEAYTSGSNTALEQGLLKDLNTLAVTFASANTSIYTESRFLGITLDPQSTLVLLNKAGKSTAEYLQLNRYLLEDAYPEYNASPLSADTSIALASYAGGANSTLEGLLKTDLNSIVEGGVFYSNKRFASVSWAKEETLSLLMQNPTSGANLKRLNRLLLEEAYPTFIIGSQLASFTLVNVPNLTTEVSAKTAWNLRVRMDLNNGAPFIMGTSGNDVVANFVADSDPAWDPAKDFMLRGGEMSNSNTINVTDYNALTANYGKSQAAGSFHWSTDAADTNGDGVVNFDDYTLMQQNWLKSGDATDVK